MSGGYYADPSSPGRVVELKDQDPTGYTVETVKAADSASTERAVGKVTHVSKSTFRRFQFLGRDHCTFCGYTQHRQPDGSYHCPVTD